MDYEEGTHGWIYVCCDESAVWSSTVITENTVLEKFILGRERKTGNRDYFGVGDEVAERKRSVVYNTAII
jgi:hypothetical protein